MPPALIASVPTQFLRQGLRIPTAPVGETAAQLSTGSPQAWNKNLQQAMIGSWSMGVQRQLTRTMMLELTYVGTKGNRLLINSVNLNEAQPGAGAVGPRRPYYTINPNLANINYVTSWGQSK